MKLVLAILFPFLLYVPKAESSLIYDWSGTCLVHCTGVAHAVYTVRDGYVPGTPFNCGIVAPAFNCPITRIVFTDNTRTTEWNDFGHPFFLGAGLLPASPFDAGYVQLDFGVNLNTPIWSGVTDGAFLVENPTPDLLGRWSYWGCCDGSGFFATEFSSQGIGGRFTLATVPEPGTLALILIALAALQLRSSSGRRLMGRM